MNVLEVFDLGTRKQIVKIIFYCFLAGVMIGAYVAHKQTIKNKENKSKIERHE